MAFDLEERPQRCGEQSKQTTKTGKKRMRGEGHGWNSSVRRTLQAQACHIAPRRFCARLLASNKIYRFFARIDIEDTPSLQVSNTDQLSWYRALIMVLEMSTSSLFQVL